jgi:ribose-phosphate pyrophosphokinase
MMLKLSDKQHVIGTEGMEKEVHDIVEKLANNFSDVSYEIVPYREFANRETKVVLNESVRGKYTHIINNIANLKSSLSSSKFNDLLMHDILIRQCAITHGAKWLSVNTIPYYNITRQIPLLSSEALPVWDKNVDFSKNVFAAFDERKRMFPPQQEQIHLIGTQDTANIVNTMQQYLIQEIGSHAVSSEISTYQESKQWMTKIIFGSPIEKKHVYVVGDVNGSASMDNLNISYNDRLMQIFLLAHWSTKYRAKTINLVPTCFPYSRQDKPTQGGLKERTSREPSSAQFIMDIIQNYLWVDYCLTMDIHNPAIINNSNQTSFVNLYTWWMVLHVTDILRKQGKNNIVISPMDEWWLKKLSSISKDLDINYITVIKKREKANSVDEIFVYGDVKNKDVLIHDDMLDTWGSLIKLIEKLHELGARSINVSITHGMFNKDAIAKLQSLHDQGLFENIYITNTVCRDKSFYPDFVKVIDASKNFADPIKSIYLWKSINYNLWVQNTNQ